MNATLQCLSNTRGLTDYFLGKYKKDRKIGWQMNITI